MAGARVTHTLLDTALWDTTETRVASPERALAPEVRRGPVPRPGSLPLAIAGLGTALPTRVVTNEELAARLDTNDEWIRSRTGIERRHVIGPTESTTTLAIAAAHAALADAQIAAADLGAIVVATSTPDTLLPATAPAVAAALGCEAFAFDLNAACAGFVTALATAAGLSAMVEGPVLVVGADSMTGCVDPEDRTTAVLFGDGAGAVVLVADEAGELGPFDLGSDGTQRELLHIPPGQLHVIMQGREIYRRAVARMASSSLAVLDRAQLTVADVDLVVAHQANRRILDAVAARIGVDADRVHVSVDRHGNTSAASIPLALADARDAGRLRPGTTLLLTAFGAGLTWGSTLLTWRSAASAQAPKNDQTPDTVQIGWRHDHG